jgi:phenylpropionate dioxygenase-like ring-hydroxylating dioxygenase large terminal subunit
VHPDRCLHLAGALSEGNGCADRLACPFHELVETAWKPPKKRSSTSVAPSDNSWAGKII